MPNLQTISNDERDALTRLAVETAKADLLSFVMLMDNNFSVGPHHRLICDELMKIETGENDRLMVFLPPRTSKSTITSIYFPAWCLGRNPWWQWMGVSHGDKLAIKFSREVRDLVNSPQFQAIFPGVAIKKDNSAADTWRIQYNGKGAGHYFAAGTSQKIAGFGANCASIDDPISEQDAWSKAKRETVNEWYPGGLRSRLQPGGRVVITQTRWHENDLSGFLLQMADDEPGADQWRIIKIPAFVTPESIDGLTGATERLIELGILPPNYPMPEIGESFWPSGQFEGGYCWPTTILQRTRFNTPPYQWDAIYMQAPSAMDGGIFKLEYWKAWDKGEPPECDYVIQSYDTAFSTKTSADFSAITTWGIYDKHNGEHEEPEYHMILLGAEKKRWEYPDLRARALEKYEKTQPDAVLVEKKASGQSLIQDLRLAGIPVFEFQPDKDKEARAHAISALFHAGKVHAPLDKRWAQEVMEECRQFPNGTYDDYVDTVTQAALWLRNGGWISHPKDAWNMLSEYDIMNQRTRRRYY